MISTAPARPTPALSPPDAVTVGRLNLPSGIKRSKKSSISNENDLEKPILSDNSNGGVENPIVVVPEGAPNTASGI